MNINIINHNLIIVISAILIFSIFIYTFYNNIFTTVISPSNTNTNVGVFNKLQFALIRLSTIGTTVSTKVTEVKVTDEELHSLLEVVFREIGNSNQISVGLLNSFGLYTPTVVAYLQNLGYIIISSS